MTTSRNTQISLLLFYCWRVLWPLSQSLRRFITLFYYRLMIFCHRCTSLLYHAVCGVGWNCWADWSEQKWYESLKHYTPIDVYAYTFFVEIGNVELKTHPYSTLIHRVSVHDDYYFTSVYYYYFTGWKTSMNDDDDLSKLGGLERRTFL